MLAASYLLSLMHLYNDVINSRALVVEAQLTCRP